MNHEHVLGKVESDELQEVPGSVGSRHEKPWRVLADLNPRDDVFICVREVLVGNSVASCRRMDLHSLSVIRKNLCEPQLLMRAYSGLAEGRLGGGRLVQRSGKHD
ncbi:MAG: hypothetical protein ACRD6W_03010, partial [Nitrososphaerales archaeon]